MNYIITLCLIFITLFSFAQEVTYSTGKFHVNKKAMVKVAELNEDWSPSIMHLQMPFPGGEKEKSELARVKEEVMKRYPRRSADFHYKTDSVRAPSPIVVSKFKGNIFNNRIPNDNHLAISNDGKLISVINSTMYIFDVQKDTLLKKVSLAAFSDSLKINGSKFDPKVLYDPDNDKFILTFLNGNTDSTSYVILAFSQSNDPTGTWNLYSLSGNPFDDKTWSDYPAIGITKDELFLTVNQLVNGEPWQTGFVQTLVWQINKQSGYDGDTSLTTRLWSDIKLNGQYLRNLTPANGGSGPYGPNQYLLSNRNFAVQSDSILLVEITNHLDHAETRMDITLLHSDRMYGAPPPARQKAGQFFDTNDGRVLGVFLENDQLQFVSNTVDTSTGFAAVYHGIISNVTGQPKVHGVIIGDTALDFGYPNISYTGKGAGENQCIISFEHSSTTVGGGCSAIFYSDDGHYSDVITLRNGIDVINFEADEGERWGDYTGSQRKYNEPGTVWVSAMFANADKSFLGYINQRNGTWISELQAPTGVTTVNESNSVNIDWSLYPNPAKDFVSFEFNSSEATFARIELYDIDGRLVKNLLSERVKPGKNRFSFSTQPLSPGIYILKISGQNGLLLQDRVVKQ